MYVKKLNIYFIEKGFREEVATARRDGIKVAAQEWAKKLYNNINEQEIIQKARELVMVKGIKGSDATAAYNVYQAYMQSLFPRIAWMTWKLISPYLGVSEPHIYKHSIVVFKTPLPGGCPMIRACSKDMELCEALCRENFHNWAFNLPQLLISIKAVNPRARWELYAFRRNPSESCEYAIII
jgi:hypothetical protein